jgi:mannobiose 2-epimerase
MSDSKTQSLKTLAINELNAILAFWSQETIDEKNGGFIGEIDYNNLKNYEADKGSVLYARILWSFSAAYALNQEASYKILAKRAFEAIKHHFYDNEFGGIFWSITHNGKPKDTKNQIYALAFTIYGLAEYYKISRETKALNMAVSLFRKIEAHSYDAKHEGYFEAFSRDWQPLEDLRLSEKDANEKKTMNTHLHIVEAYANLYQIWPEFELKVKIREILYVISAYFINKETWHLKLFFDENWVEKPDVISYGHDIEAAWLLLWCAETIEDKNLIEEYKQYAVAIANATIEGIDTDGGLWYEFDPHESQLIAEKHWWPQAELLIGMTNAFQLTQDTNYLDIVVKNFEFIQNYIIDKENGEWIWGINADSTEIKKDKAGFWKCPYHNSRACIELIKRL